MRKAPNLDTMRALLVPVRRGFSGRDRESSNGTRGKRVEVVGV